MIHKAGLLVALLSLGGCEWVGQQADALGEYMPVIDYRCEHWQCLTFSGQAQSEANKMQAAQAEQAYSKEPLPDSTLKNVPQQ